MITNYVIIINPNSAEGGEAIPYLNKINLQYVLCKTQKRMQHIINKNTKNDFFNFIICGGDGTVNSFVQAFMTLPNDIRSKVKLGVLPCGKANDLTRQLSIPQNKQQALQQLLIGREKRIDIFQVNEKYFITGGGIGLSAEVVVDAANFSKKFRRTNKWLKDTIYYFFVLKRLFFGYSGIADITIDSYKYSGDHMLIAFMNQGFMGKRFNLSPHAKNDDGIIEICILPKKGIFSDLHTVRMVILGKHKELNNVIFIKKKQTLIKTNTKTLFMGDGEILEYNNSFHIRIIEKGITLLY